MVTITYYRDKHRVTIKGHAQSAEAGKDLVCAAVSALARTLEGNIRQLVVCSAASDPVIDIESGSADLSCNPNRKSIAVVELVFDSICIGFKLLAARFPEYLDYQVR